MVSSKSIPATEVERMMKLQDVLLKAMAKRISWLSAAEIIGVTPRTMRRWRERMEEQGYDGLRDRRKGKASQPRRCDSSSRWAISAVALHQRPNTLAQTQTVISIFRLPFCGGPYIQLRVLIGP